MSCNMKQQTELRLPPELDDGEKNFEIAVNFVTGVVKKKKNSKIRRWAKAKKASLTKALKRIFPFFKAS